MSTVVTSLLERLRPAQNHFKASQLISLETVRKMPGTHVAEKNAVAGLISSTDWRTYLRCFEQFPILLGCNVHGKWEVIGGGQESEEEKALDSIMRGALFPAHQCDYAGAFYHLQSLSILSSGHFSPLTYKESVEDVLEREAREEGIESKLEYKHLFRQNEEIPLVFRPRNPNLRAALEARFPEMYTHACYAQVIKQRGVFCLTDTAYPDLPEFFPNDEIIEIKWFTVGELCESYAHLRNGIPFLLIQWFLESYGEDEYISW